MWPIGPSRPSEEILIVNEKWGKVEERGREKRRGEGGWKDNVPSPICTLRVIELRRERVRDTAAWGVSGAAAWGFCGCVGGPWRGSRDVRRRDAGSGTGGLVVELTGVVVDVDVVVDVWFFAARLLRVSGHLSA